MAWSGSAMFVTWAQSVMGNGDQTTPTKIGNLYTGLANDTVNVALYNNTTTPSKTDTTTHASYNGTGGPWVTANEVTDVTNWVAGGRALGTKTLASASNVFTFGAANLAGGGTVTITNAFGCLAYDNTITAGTGGVAKPGITYHDFGGGQSVTSGTFTIVWNASGIFTVTV